MLWKISTIFGVISSIVAVDLISTIVLESFDKVNVTVLIEQNNDANILTEETINDTTHHFSEERVDASILSDITSTVGNDFNDAINGSQFMSSKQTSEITSAIILNGEDNENSFSNEDLIETKIHNEDTPYINMSSNGKNITEMFSKLRTVLRTRNDGENVASISSVPTTASSVAVTTDFSVYSELKTDPNTTVTSEDIKESTFLNNVFKVADPSNVSLTTDPSVVSLTPDPSDVSLTTDPSDSCNVHINANKIWNNLADIALEIFRDKLTNRGEDIMPIPNIEQSFSTRFMFIPVYGFFVADNGWFHNLSTIQRTGDIRVTHANKVFTFQSSLGLGVMKMGYDHYEIVINNIGPRPNGNIEGSVGSNSIELTVDLELGTNNCITKLVDLKVVEFDDLKLKVTGFGLFNDLVSVKANEAIERNKSFIVKSMESVLKREFSKILNKLDCNKIIACIADQL